MGSARALHRSLSGFASFSISPTEWLLYALFPSCATSIRTEKGDEVEDDADLALLRDDEVVSVLCGEEEFPLPGAAAAEPGPSATEPPSPATQPATPAKAPPEPPPVLRLGYRPPPKTIRSIFNTVRSRERVELE